MVAIIVGLVGLFLPRKSNFRVERIWVDSKCRMVIPEHLRGDLGIVPESYVEVSAEPSREECRYLAVKKP